MSKKSSKKRQRVKTRTRRSPHRSRLDRHSSSIADPTRPGQNPDTRFNGRTASLNQAKVALGESATAFQKIFEYAGIGIAIMDMAGRFQLCNPAYCALIGYSQEELRHLNFAALVHPEDRAANLLQVQRLKDQALPFFEIENRYIHKDGRPVLVRKVASVLPDATGKATHLIALVTDITERKRVEGELRSREELLERLTSQLLTAQDEERGRIARELHDDFSQRLASLVLDLQALEERPPVLPEQVPHAVEPIRIEVRRLADDIHNLAYDLHPTLLNHAGLVPAIKDHIHHVSQRTGLRIALKTRHVPGAIPLDRSLCLFRVLQESLRNVHKHAKATSVLVRLLRTKRGVGLCVHDDGCGFEVVEGAVSRKGLGLTSMAERIGALKGMFRIKTKPGDGTEIHTWVPLSEGQP